MHALLRHHRHRPARPGLVARWVHAWALACTCVCTAGLVFSTAATALEPSAESEPPPLAELTTDELGWQPLVSVTEGFRALLPRDETWEESGLRETIIGTVAEKKYFARSEGRTFSVGLHMLPRLGKFFAPSSLILSKAKKNVLISDSGRELTYERRRMGDYPGALLTFEPKDSAAGDGVTEVHLVLVGQRLYVLKASHAEPGAGRSAADRFFDSFEVLE